MREYIVVKGGVELTVQLSEETAKRLNARPAHPEVESKERRPANKARRPTNK